MGGRAIGESTIIPRRSSPKAPMLLLALSMAGCAVPVTFYTETDTEIRLIYGGGGVLSVKRALYEPLYTTDKRVVIDGMMVSADAFYALGIPGVCYTERVVWAPHAISAGGLYRLGAETDAIMLYLPDPLAKHFRASPYYWNFITAGGIYYAELLTIWPEGACNQGDILVMSEPD